MPTGSKGGVAGRFRRSAGPSERPRRVLATQGVFGFEPIGRDRRTRLAALRTPEGASLPPRLRAEIGRQMDRLELVIQQLAAVEAERDAAFAAECTTSPSASGVVERASGREQEPLVPLPPPSDEGPGARLLRLKGVGPETASVLAGEAFFRDFRNRREIASYAGLAPSPGQAVASTASRASPSRATHGYARPWGSSRGCGCATNRTAP
jgi:transposase